MSRKVAATLSLLALSTLSLSSVSAYALDGAVKATTKWTVGRVASMTQGSYCTMAQKFSDASVVTFAKNGRGEYSLAVDFADPQFKSGEKLKVGLAAQGGAKETFSVTPQSAKTVVVGLGKDAALVASLKKVGALVVTIGEGHKILRWRAIRQVFPILKHVSRGLLPILLIKLRIWTCRKKLA